MSRSFSQRSNRAANPPSVVASAVGGNQSELSAGIPRNTLALLLDPLFGPYFVGKLASTVGVWVFSMVAAVVMWDLTSSALAVGSVGVAMFVPQLIFAPLSGAQADRRDPKMQLIVGRMVVALGGAALSAALWGGVERLLSPSVVVVAAATVGIGYVIGGPAQHSLLPSMVRDVEVPRIVALNALAPIIARAGGPVLGTWVLVAAGPHWAFSLTALTNFFFGCILAILPLSGRVERAMGGTHTVRHGFSYISTERSLAYLLLAVLAVGFGADPMITLTPALSTNLGEGEKLIGILAASFGAGAVCSYPAISILRRRNGDQSLTANGLAALSIGLILVSLASSAPIAALGLGLAGIGFSWGVTGATTQIYNVVPGSFRGRVMALWSVAFVGSRPISAAFSGALTDAISVTFAFFGVGIIVAILGIIAHGGRRRLSKQ